MNPILPVIVFAVIAIGLGAGIEVNRDIQKTKHIEAAASVAVACLNAGRTDCTTEIKGGK